jgi:hypothetical protein
MDAPVFHHAAVPEGLLKRLKYRLSPALNNTAALKGFSGAQVLTGSDAAPVFCLKRTNHGSAARGYLICPLFASGAGIVVFSKLIVIS